MAPWPGASGAATAMRPRTAAAWCCGSPRAPATSCSTRRTVASTVGAGVSIDELLRVIVPRGFFVPVTPGTRFVTIGGAIASDIHGKNHHVDGSIGNHIESITMMLADGSTTVIGPDQQPGAVLGDDRRHGSDGRDARRHHPPAADRDQPDARRHVARRRPRHAVGDDELRRRRRAVQRRLDRPRRQGTPPRPQCAEPRRSCPARATSTRATAVAPFAYGPHQLVAVPPLVPPMGVLNHATIAAFNEAWFRRAPEAPNRRDPGDRRLLPSTRSRRLVEPPVRQSRHGPVPVRRSVRPGGRDAHRGRATLGQRCSQLPRCAEAVRRGQPCAARASRRPGGRWRSTLPARRDGLGDLLHGLDRVVLDAGGRHYFAKDAHMTPEAVRRGYPRLDEWKAVRDEVDPLGVWQSDLGRRLGLI